jgi:hypothetical protein
VRSVLLPLTVPAVSQQNVKRFGEARSLRSQVYLNQAGFVKGSPKVSPKWGQHSFTE